MCRLDTVSSLVWRSFSHGSHTMLVSLSPLYLQGSVHLTVKDIHVKLGHSPQRHPRYRREACLIRPVDHYLSWS